MCSIDGGFDAAVAEATAAVDAALAAAGAGALQGSTHEELTARLERLRALAARAEAVLLAVVREVDARGSHLEEGMLTTGAWLRAHARMAPREAQAAVRTARALGAGRLDATAAALAAGEIDPGQARAIARGVADAPAGAVGLIEPAALAAAREADVRAVAAVLRRFAHALDPDAADAAAVARYDRRGLTLAPALDGSVVIGGRADEATGALIATAVDAAAPLVAGDRRNPGQRRLDGLADICRRYLASDQAPTAGGGGRPQVIVTVDAATLTAGPGDTGSPGGTLCWVGPIGGSTAGRIACDAAVTLVGIDAGGEVTGVARARRFFTAAQRAAMIGRDGDRCAVPWCDRPVAWADGHHLTPWARGGPTTVGNGALPCAGHHTLLHEGHWALERLPDGRYLIRHRDGRVIGPEPHPPGHNRPTPHRRE